MKLIEKKIILIKELLSANISVNLMAVQNILYVCVFARTRVYIHVGYSKHAVTSSLLLSRSRILSLSFSPSFSLYVLTFILSVAALRGLEYLAHYTDHVTRSAIKSQTMCMIR